MITNNVIIVMFSVLALSIASLASMANEQEVPVNEPIVPIPLTIDLDQEKVALGEKLFNDVRLSQNDSTACASCHQLADGGDDNLAIGSTQDGTPHIINTPSLFNARYNFR